MNSQDTATIERLRAWIEATPIVLKIGTALILAGSMFASGFLGHIRGSAMVADLPVRVGLVEVRLDSLSSRITNVERILPLADSIQAEVQSNTFLLCVLVNRELAADSPQILACGTTANR